VLFFLVRRTGISPLANIFARGSREQAPIALLAKCEPMRLLCNRRFDLRNGVKKQKDTL
jgi:hypothetical protein